MTAQVRRPLAVLVLALATLFPATAAYADAITWRDHAGDMWRYDGTEDTSATPAPGHHNGDVTKVKVLHHRHAVVIRQIFVDLARRGKGHSFIGRIRTDSGLLRTFHVSAVPGNWGGELEITKGPSSFPVQCDGAKHVLNYSTNTATVRIPRRCLHHPRWVQVRLNNWHTGSGDRIFNEDPHAPGHAPMDTWWSDRVRRG